MSINTLFCEASNSPSMPLLGFLLGGPLCVITELSARKPQLEAAVNVIGEEEMTLC